MWKSLNFLKFFGKKIAYKSIKIIHQYSAYFSRFFKSVAGEFLWVLWKKWNLNIYEDQKKIIEKEKTFFVLIFLCQRLAKVAMNIIA